MSVVAISFRENLNVIPPFERFETARKVSLSGCDTSIEKHFQYNEKDIRGKFHSSAHHYDSLLDFVNWDDFYDDEKLEKNFKEIIKIHEQGVPVKIVRESCFPGILCIPIFHCKRRLSLWSEAFKIPGICSRGEINRNVYGIPVSIARYDSLTKILNCGRNASTGKTCNPFNVNKLSKTGYKLIRKNPIAEFVDINERFAIYSRKFSLSSFKGNEFAPNGSVLHHTSLSDVPGNSIDDGSKSEDIVTDEMENCCKNSGKNTQLDSSNNESNTIMIMKSKDVRKRERVHYTSCNKQVKKNSLTHKLGNQLKNGLMISSKANTTSKKYEVQHNTTKVKQQPAKPRPKTRSHKVTFNVTYERKLEELRRTERGLGRTDLNVEVDVVSEKEKCEDDNIQNDRKPFWFRDTKTKGEVSKAFVFSYFDLLRRI